MCGRFNLITCSDALVEHFKLQQPVRFQSSYNITPAQKILTIVELEDQTKNPSICFGDWYLPGQKTAKTVLI